jgi:hypothetical protein
MKETMEEKPAGALVNLISMNQSEKSDIATMETEFNSKATIEFFSNQKQNKTKKQGRSLRSKKHTSC